MEVIVNDDPRSRSELLSEVDRLNSLLCEANDTLDAIHSGDLDALVVAGPDGDRIYSLATVERTYRLIVETMNEAALSVGFDGTILFCNRIFCDLMKENMQKILSRNITDFVKHAEQPLMENLLTDAQAGYVRRFLTLQGVEGALVPVQISTSLLSVDTVTSICMVVTDLTELVKQSSSIQEMREQQEILLKRKNELQIINALYDDSRRAALNIMEDAVSARQKTEEALNCLQNEIDERKRFEEALHKAHTELESRVLERTHDLLTLNERLILEISDRKKAEESLQKAFLEIQDLKMRLQAENIYLQQEIAQESNFGEIIGQSNAIRSVFLRVEQVAPMDATVLLLGETGVGKGVIARAIHSRSTHSGRPMITVNCSSLPANLIESELFGRERGAFTGADARQMGRFELADNGTIFLDEIGEMPLDLQCKLLRVIQDGEFERLGSPRTIKVHIRIIAASNRKLEEEVKNGRFREDLFYRLNVFPITIPPLRQRTEDIPLLVNHFIAKFNKKNGKKINIVQKDTMNSLQEYQWPGNVRELESVIERAIIISQGSTLNVMDRFDAIIRQEDPSGEDVKALVELEHDHILAILHKTGWRIEGKNGAALLLGLNPSTLRARMRKSGIQRQ